MTGSTVLVGLANEGEISIKIETIKEWQISNISYFSDVVYFKGDNAYYSMKRNDFKQIFNK
jgi:hypothetical protein